MITEIITTMEASLPYVSIGMLNQLLHSIGKSGKTETMIKVSVKSLSDFFSLNVDSMRYIQALYFLSVRLHFQPCIFKAILTHFLHFRHLCSFSIW